MVEKTTNRLIITDVTLREYGQNVPASYLHVFTTEKRVDIALRLIDAGFANIEVLSCVHPKVAPAMNESSLKGVAGSLGKPNSTNLITLVPNKAGYKRFLDIGLGPDGYNHTMGIFFSAVEAHNLSNLGRAIKETLEEYKIIVKDAIDRGIRVIAYISAAFGYIEPRKRVIVRADIDEINHYIDLFFDLGVDTVTMTDLQGVAQQRETKETLETLMEGRKGKDIDRLGYHPHNVAGEKAIANSKIAYDLGIMRFDSSLGGSGGCVTGAPGNQPTEDLVSFFTSLGIETSVDEKKVLSLTRMIQKELFSRITLEPLKGEKPHPP